MHSVNFFSPFITGILAVITIFIGVFLKARIAKIFSVSLSIFAVLFSFLPLGMELETAMSMQTPSFTLFVGWFYHILVAIVAVTSIIIIANDKNPEVSRFESYPLIVLSFAGMLFAIFAENMIGIYLGLELNAIAGYVIASLNRVNAKSNEASMKYFLIGAVSSCFMIYGISLVYGFSGGNFNINEVSYEVLTQNSLALTIGFLMFILGLLFKTTTFPFHFWASDVYSGMNSSSLSFISIAPKIVAFFVMLKIFFFKLSHIPNAEVVFMQIVFAFSAISMVIGAFGALRQNEIKRILAYSGIFHMALVFSLFSVNFLPYNVLYYFLIYTFINIGIFAIISALSRNPSYDETLESIKGLAKSNPYIAFSFSVLMLSSAGIPPLAGFFIKYSVLVVLIQNGSYILPIIAIIASVISSFYYLKIIKVMYFEEQSKEFALNAKQSKTPLFIKLLILSAIIVNVTFIFV